MTGGGCDNDQAVEMKIETTHPSFEVKGVKQLNLGQSGKRGVKEAVDERR